MNGKWTFSVIYEILKNMVHSELGKVTSYGANTLVVVDFALEPKEGEGSQVQDVYFAVAHFPN